MLPEMTPQEIANEICIRQVQSRIYGEGETFVMVEGKTDQVLWEEFRAQEDCTIYPAKGKDKIIAALKIAANRELRGVAGIVDADYWLINDEVKVSTENLLYDECCPDMELILCKSDALKKVLRHEMSGDEIDVKAIHHFADSLKQQSLTKAAKIGYFRLLNERENYGLNFKALLLADFVDNDALELDSEWLARRLVESRSDLSSIELLREVDKLRRCYSQDKILLCRGKDVISIMSHIVPHLYQIHFKKELPASAREIFQEKQLAKELRKAYEFIYFQDTSLFRRICDWQAQNQSYRILRHPCPKERTTP